MIVYSVILVVEIIIAGMYIGSGIIPNIILVNAAVFQCIIKFTKCGGMGV